MNAPARAPFPSLTLSAAGMRAQGSFAENQRRYLEPDAQQVQQLGQLLKQSNAGLVAHFYMDVELQGVLYACDWPHIQISDSLIMADNAVRMAKAGIKTIVVLGVDFMSENVRAMLDASGFEDVAVYRVAEAEIGCSLAESAEALGYGAYLSKAAAQPKSLHVVYINTSLRTKAQSQRLVPTITCTSSNVVRTILQAAAQEPEISIWFGPDTYMGANLEVMFQNMSEMSEAQVRELHPDHTPASIAALLSRFHYYGQGNCVVHHLFGAQVVAQVREDYQDAQVTAHLEVPGEMFELALEGQRAGQGVVGSTSNILRYIEARVEASIEANRGGTERFVLGTEAGMVSAIVRAVASKLRAAGTQGPEVEIIFPVAAEAVLIDPNDAVLPMVPGAAGGEGCTTAGGCATCPYMKMNSLDATVDLLARVSQGEDASALAGFEPRKYAEQLDGKSVAELGGLPILHMRDFQRDGELSADLLSDIRTRHA